ncbi:MAG: hypothetical protein FWF19_05075 [Euryarchaeota archaeon]|nr:hypothetical protein [Euryarchaeota archaeon]
MSKQIIFRVDDDLKILADAIMAARGENQQSVLDQAYRDYVFEHAGDVDDLLQVVYSYVTERQRADIIPLLEKMEQQQSAKAAEEAKQAELMEQYDKICATKPGKQLLDILARRLQRDEPRYAFADVFQDNVKLFREMFKTGEDNDDNKLIDTAMSMARIHTTQ